MEDCWLTSKGEIIEVGKCCHNDYASELLKEEMGRKEYLDYICGINKSPYVVLHERGWVRIKYHTSYEPKIEILGGCIDLTRQRKNTMDPAMNSRQMRIAKLMCQEVGEDFIKAINDKRFW